MCKSVYLYEGYKQIVFRRQTLNYLVGMLHIHARENDHFKRLDDWWVWSQVQCLVNQPRTLRSHDHSTGSHDGEGFQTSC